MSRCSVVFFCSAFFDNIITGLAESATVAQLVEQLICNHQVGGSNPFGGSTERFPSGQREQTVNLPALPSEVQILPSPPANFARQNSEFRVMSLETGSSFNS